MTRHALDRRGTLAATWLAFASLAFAPGASSASARSREPRAQSGSETVVVASQLDALRATARARLAELGAELAAQEPLARERVAELVDVAFRSRGLSPEFPSVVRDDAQLRAARGTVGERVFEGQGGATEALSALVEHWRGASDVQVELELASVRPAAQTNVRFTARWRTADGLHQLASNWNCAWNAAETPKLLAVDVDGLEEVRVREPLFADVTEAVLGETSAWREELQHGADHWAARIDRALGEPLLGETGLAVGDANGDGLDDLYVCRPGGLPNRLFLREADGRAREAASAAGLDFLDPTRAALFLDLDDDGDQDLAATLGDELVLARNDGTGRFELAVRLPVPAAFGLAAADIERDGDLDFFVCAFREPASAARLPFPSGDARTGFRSVLLRCEEPFRFVDATRESGLERHGRRFTRSAAFEDYDDDGDADLLLAVDFGPLALFRNDAGRFLDVSATSIRSRRSASSGASWSDFDGDGDFDLCVSGRFPSSAALLSNDGDGTFADTTRAAGLANSGWSLGALFLDVDGDGREDLYVPRGYVTGADPTDVFELFELGAPASLGEYADQWTGAFRGLRRGGSWHGAERNRVLLNVGAVSLVDVSAVSGADFQDDARAAARCDWNGDGRVDLWLASRKAPGLRLIVGAASHDGSFVELELVGGAKQRDAIGARVELVVAGSSHRRIMAVRAGEGQLAQSTKRLFFALPKDATVERALVRWPDGERETFGGLAASGRQRLTRGTGRAEPLATRKVALPVAPAAERAPDAPSAARATSDDGHLTLAARPTLPPLEALDETGVLRKLTALARPLVVLLWQVDCAPCVEQLRGLAPVSADAKRTGFDLVALSLDESARRQDAADALASLGWRAGYAFGEAAFAHRVELLLRELSDRERRLAPPAVLVIDRENRLVAVNHGPYALATLARDVAHAGRPESDWRGLATPFPGRWLGAAPKADLIALARAFAAAGCDDAARAWELELAARAESSGANALFARGVAELEAQRFAEAGELLEQALRAEPAHFEALGALAYSLQARARLVEAIAAHRRALELRPADSATRYNLVAALAQNDERESAAVELFLLSEIDPRAAEELRTKLGW